MAGNLSATESRRNFLLPAAGNLARYFRQMMAGKNYTIALSEQDLGQLLDGLEVRADSWRRTAEYLRHGESSDGEFFIIEECSDPEEADALASQYDAIIASIRSQMNAQE